MNYVGLAQKKEEITSFKIINKSLFLTLSDHLKIYEVFYRKLGKFEKKLVFKFKIHSPEKTPKNISMKKYGENPITIVVNMNTTFLLFKLTLTGDNQFKNCSKFKSFKVPVYDKKLNKMKFDFESKEIILDFELVKDTKFFYCAGCPKSRIHTYDLITGRTDYTFSDVNSYTKIQFFMNFQFILAIKDREQITIFSLNEENSQILKEIGYEGKSRLASKIICDYNLKISHVLFDTHQDYFLREFQDVRIYKSFPSFMIREVKSSNLENDTVFFAIADEYNEYNYFDGNIHEGISFKISHIFIFTISQNGNKVLHFYDFFDKSTPTPFKIDCLEVQIVKREKYKRSYLVIVNRYPEHNKKIGEFNLCLYNCRDPRVGESYYQDITVLKKISINNTIIGNTFSYIPLKPKFNVVDEEMKIICDWKKVNFLIYTEQKCLVMVQLRRDSEDRGGEARRDGNFYWSKKVIQEFNEDEYVSNAQMLQNRNRRRGGLRRGGDRPEAQFPNLRQRADERRLIENYQRRLNESSSPDDDEEEDSESSGDEIVIFGKEKNFGGRIHEREEMFTQGVEKSQSSSEENKLDESEDFKTEKWSDGDDNGAWDGSQEGGNWSDGDDNDDWEGKKRKGKLKNSGNNADWKKNYQNKKGYNYSGSTRISNVKRGFESGKRGNFRNEGDHDKKTVYISGGGSYHRGEHARRGSHNHYNSDQRNRRGHVKRGSHHHYDSYNSDQRYREGHFRRGSYNHYKSDYKNRGGYRQRGYRGNYQYHNRGDKRGCKKITKFDSNVNTSYYQDKEYNLSDRVMAHRGRGRRYHQNERTRGKGNFGGYRNKREEEWQVKEETKKVKSEKRKNEEKKEDLKHSQKKEFKPKIEKYEKKEKNERYRKKYSKGKEEKTESYKKKASKRENESKKEKTERYRKKDYDEKYEKKEKTVRYRKKDSKRENEGKKEKTESYRKKDFKEKKYEKKRNFRKDRYRKNNDQKYEKKSQRYRQNEKKDKKKINFYEEKEKIEKKFENKKNNYEEKKKLKKNKKEEKENFLKIQMESSDTSNSSDSEIIEERKNFSGRYVEKKTGNGKRRNKTKSNWRNHTGNKDIINN